MDRVCSKLVVQKLKIVLVEMHHKCIGHGIAVLANVLQIDVESIPLGLNKFGHSISIDRFPIFIFEAAIQLKKKKENRLTSRERVGIRSEYELLPGLRIAVRGR